ncbi:hypothetical protein E4U15_006548 [Claviceps sp. LM218 group G6]|nr:hypothetical protein E4U15_006548 [Claviceps sp. LM218 group G6]KAG6122947.1 hypothetical protein E4U14_002317 [Claviceps sp. LM454 group G7]
MRITQTLGSLCGAVMAVTAPTAASASATASLDASWLPSATSVPLTTANCQGHNSTAVRHASALVNANATFPVPTIATVPTNLVNATASPATGVTGGAIPQQMQASMAGLLGFCIMGLVML